MSQKIIETSIVLAKYADKVLLRYSSAQGDLNFLSASVLTELDQQNPIRPAYKMVSKDFDLIGGLDFELEKITPPLVEYKKKGTNGEPIVYRFHLFFLYLKSGTETLLNSPNNRWIKTDLLKPGFKDSLSVPLSSLVPYILSQITISKQDSFNYEIEANVKEYRAEVIKAVTDIFSPGFIDETERKILDRKKRELKLSDLDAKKIEHEILASVKTTETIEIENKHLLDSIHSFPKIIEDIQYYARIKKYKKITIQNIFNEGKTGALVFQIQGKKENETVSKILKYDFYLRIQKEYNNFMDNERLHGVFASPKWEQFLLEENAFLELQPADEFANAKEMNSMRQIISSKIKLISDDVSVKTNFVDALREILDWIFRKVYKSGDGSYIIRTQKYQNAFDHFLPPRWILNGKIYAKDQAGPVGLTRIPSNNIIGFDIKVNREKNLLQLSAKVWFTQKNSPLMYRCDVVCNLDQKDLELLGRQNWVLYVSKGSSQDHRKDFLQELKNSTEWLWSKANRFMLSPILKEVKANNTFEIGYYIDQLLQKSGKVFLTNFLHGDFNPSNLLFCRSESQKFYPILIDFYDTGMTGSIFYDLARLEVEMVVLLLTNYMNKVLGTNLNAESLPDSEIELILDWEEKIFSNEQPNIFSGDFLVLEFRKILFELAARYLKDDFLKFFWLKNFFLALGIFGLGFQKFKNESNLSRYIALIWSSRSLYRFDNFEYLIEVGSFKKIKLEDFLTEDLQNPIEKLKAKCMKSNSLYEIEHGSLQISYELFVDYNIQIKNHILAFLKNTQSSLFSIVDESGSGKTWFINYLLSNELSEYPALFIAGNVSIKGENSYIQQIQNSLKMGTDWIDIIQDIDLKDSKYCLCLIIDNISDNTDPEAAKEALKALLKHIKGTKINLIALIEPWYWLDFLEKDDLIKNVSYRIHDPENKAKFSLFSSMDKPIGVHRDILVYNYFKQYDIIGELTDQALLIANKPGFLKQFCEVMEGKRIGKLDHISRFDTLQSYTKLKNHSLAKELGINIELVNEIIFSIVKEMQEQQLGAIKIVDILEEIPHSVKGIKGHFLVQFIKAGMQVKYFQRHTTRLIFIFGDVQFYIDSQRIVSEWRKSPDGLLSSIQQINETKLSDFLSHSHEDITGYIARHLYLESDKTAFILYVEKIYTKFKTNTIGVLQFLSKTIPVLPHIPGKILKLLYDIEQDIQSIKKTTISDMHSNGLLF